MALVRDPGRAGCCGRWASRSTAATSRPREPARADDRRRRRVPLRRLVQGRRSRRGRAHQRRRHPPRARDHARDGDSARRLHQHRRGVLGHARRDARRVVPLRRPAPQSLRPHQVAGALRSGAADDGAGPAADHRDARPHLRPGRHQRDAHRAGGPAAQAAADHAAAHRVLLGARGRHRARSSAGDGAGHSSETYIITGPRHTFEEAFDLVAQLAKVPRAAAASRPPADAGHGRPDEPWCTKRSTCRRR